MRKKHSKTKKALKSSLLWGIASVLFTGYIVYHIAAGFAPALNTSVSVNGAETLSFVADAYIMRDEAVLTSSNSGYCDYIVGDREYAKDDDELARVYSSAPEELVGRLNEIDKEYALLKECLSDSNIDSAVSHANTANVSVVSSLLGGDVNAALDELDSLLVNSYRLDLNKLGNEEKLEAAKQKLAALREERQEILSSLGEPETIISDGTGNFFHGVDGYETAYSSANIQNMTVSDFNEMFASQPQKTDGAIGTYAKDYTWYIAIPLSYADVPGELSLNVFNADAPASSVPDGLPDNIGRTYTVNFKYTSGVSLQMKYERYVNYKSDSGQSDSAVLIFSSSSLPSGFDRTRKQTVEIDLAEYSGYRIANEAITAIDGDNGIWILKNGRVERRYVEIIYQNDIYSIVRSQEALAAPYAADADYSFKKAELENEYACLNDVYFLSDKGLYEGKLID